MRRTIKPGPHHMRDAACNAAASMGQVGLDWTVAGFGDFSGNANETDMLLRNSTSGAFEVYDISKNAITSAASMGQVGPEWSISGVAADPAGAAPQSTSIAQLTQAMASFGSTATAASNAPTVLEAADLSQRTLLTTPHA
jgi:hypothetical protein